MAVIYYMNGKKESFNIQGTHWLPVMITKGFDLMSHKGIGNHYVGSLMNYVFRSTINRVAGYRILPICLNSMTHG